MRNHKFWIGLIIVLVCPASLWAGALQMKNYAEVVVENLQVGHTYSMVSSVNLPLKLINDSDEEVTIVLDVLKPQAKYLRKGYEPIPDASWIDLGNTMTVMAAHEAYLTDVKLTIPDKKEYSGKKYQAAIRSRILPTSGAFSIGLAVQGRLLFSTTPDGVRTVIPGVTDLNYSFSPMLVAMDDIELGKKTAVMAENKPVILKNESKEPMDFTLRCLDTKKTDMKFAADSRAIPDPGFLSFESETMQLAAGEEKPVLMHINIPKKRKYRNKKYHMVVSISSGNATRYMRVTVKTKK